MCVHLTFLKMLVKLKAVSHLALWLIVTLSFWAYTFLLQFHRHHCALQIILHYLWWSLGCYREHGLTKLHYELLYDFYFYFRKRRNSKNSMYSLWEHCATACIHRHTLYLSFVHQGLLSVGNTQISFSLQLNKMHQSELCANTELPKTSQHLLVLIQFIELFSIHISIIFIFSSIFPCL